MRAIACFDSEEDALPLRLSPAEWAQLAGVMERTELQPGELLLRCGDLGSCAYLVESGQLQVFVTGGTRRSHRVATLRGGTMVGEPALFTPTLRMAHVEATAPSVVWALSAQDLLSLSAVAPALVLEVLRAAGVLMTARRRANLERGIPVS
jgi:CRP-like cAMP-binding protein